MSANGKTNVKASKISENCLKMVSDIQTILKKFSLLFIGWHILKLNANIETKLPAAVTPQCEVVLNITEKLGGKQRHLDVLCE